MTSGQPMQAVHCELLCFAVDKCRSLTADDLANIITDFYKDDEITSAKNILDGYCDSSTRLPKRRGPDKDRMTVEDIVKTVTNPTIEMPVFYTVDLTRLPPVDVTHCDVAAILKELQSLRFEVRAIRQLEKEVVELREQLSMVVHGDTLMTASTSEFPPLTDPQPRGDSTSVTARSVNYGTKYAQRAKELSSSGMAAPKPKKHVVGSSTTNKHVSSVTTMRVIDVFVSRLHALTAMADVEECVKTIGQDNNITISRIQCNKLKVRYEHLYNSVHLEIQVNAADMSRALETFMKTDSWPVGVFVRRYFKRKPVNGESE